MRAFIHKVPWLERVYWGWFVAAGAFFVMGVSYGSKYCFGLFVDPMFSDKQWPMSSIAFAASINALMYASGGLFSGRMLDKIAPKWIITTGAFFQGAGFVLTAWIQTPLQMYIAYGVVCGLGSGCTGVVVNGSSVGKWFVRKRGTAIGIASMGIGVSTMVMAPLAAFIIENYNWRTGFIFFGLVVLVVGVLISQLLMGRTAPEKYGLLPDGDPPGKESAGKATQSSGTTLDTNPANVLKDHRFWVMVACFTGLIAVQMMVFVHHVAYAVHNNIDKIAAASSVGIIGIASIFGRFFYGWLSDRIADPKYSALLGYLTMACSIVILLHMSSVAWLYFFAVTFGFGYGSVSTMMPVLLSDRFGRRVLGSTYGMLTFFTVGIGGTFGPLLGGIIYDLTQSYLAAWRFDLALLVMVSLGISTLKS